MPNHHLALASALVLHLLASCGAPSPAAASPVEAPPSLRLVTYNIKHAHGMDGAVDLDRVAAVLRPLDADVVLLQEVDEGCARSGHVDQCAWLGKALDMAPRFGPFRPFDGGLYGMAILSRLPIVSTRVVDLPPGPNPLSFLELELDYHGTPITVAGLHLVMTEAQRLAQASFLVERYRNAPDPVILAGDLNSERESSVVDLLSTEFDLPTKPDSPLTFPSVVPVKEIDFFLLAPRGAWAVEGHGVVEEPVTSDHRPVWISVAMPALRSAR